MRRGARQPELLDVLIDDRGCIAAIGSGIAVDGARLLDIEGGLVVPGLVDIHQHLDKSRTRSAVANPSGTLRGASAGYAAFAATVTRDDIVERASETLEACLERGTIAIRSHTNIDPETGLRGIEAMVEVREQWRDRVAVQIVGHVTSGATRRPADAEAWLEGAIDAGIDAVGGVPAYSDRPADFLDLLFRMASASGPADRPAYGRASRSRECPVRCADRADRGVRHAGARPSPATALR